MTLSDVYSSLVAVYADWGELLANPNFVRMGLRIAWGHYTPQRPDEPITRDAVAAMADSRQYSFQSTVDGALIQLSYEFSDPGTLGAASLAYYGVGQLEEEPVGWLRIDYDPANARGILHSRCHLHISLFPAARFLVHGVPSPRQFIEFIASACYPGLYETVRADHSGAFREEVRVSSVNRPSVPFPEEPSCRYVTHLRVPGPTPQPVALPPQTRA